MRLFINSEAVKGATRGCVLTIGNFDGLHLGHQALLRAVIARGRELGRPTALYTFDPHPRRLLYPERSQPRLMSWEQLAAGVEEAGIDMLVREHFTTEFAALSPEMFLRDVIAQRVEPMEIFVGRDFHFGKGRRGSDETLVQMAPVFGTRVEIIPQVRTGGRDVSSSRIRALLAGGEVEEAAEGLGRPYVIWGKVVEGARRGQTLGFPTANLDLENELIPRSGVYATLVRIFKGKRPSAPSIPSVTNVGTRPTFEPAQLVTEVHLIGFDGDLYGRRLELSFHARLRPERRFPGPEALARQIADDVAQARRLLEPATG